MLVHKTVKLFIGGKFPRTESGRSFPEYHNGSKEIYANVCHGSRKDFRNSVEAATKAESGWAKATAFNRGQILYRMAEMTEGKRLEFVDLFKKVLGKSDAEANAEVDAAIDAFVYYAGFTDKYQHLVGTVNPVSGPYMNYTQPEHMGVTVLICDDKFDFQKLVIDLCGIIGAGNTAVVLLAAECHSVLAPLAEVFATSDLPAGVVNLLSGHLEELAVHMAGHMEVKAVSYQHSDSKYLTMMRKEGADNMKRVIRKRAKNLTIEPLTDHLEYKTVWHPLGL
ncbi:MAG: aldehyde dehydrogenase family protein [Halobacteriovoraceae bacterium]|jgi:acyl-CoA reductase-like NAD-dependent aldehyde dehydrogenase|nr:aldehyde dehydrogenase family protein [Halobacteriovoraceae bacterium]MBT5095483.1 aldehyde dehydrogenase family protein [Halobacteriovoraceae bacterium]